MKRLRRALSEIAGRALKTLKVLPPGYAPCVRESQGRAARYRPRDPSKLRLRGILIDNLDAAALAWDRFTKTLGPWKGRYRWAAERFIGCGDPARGFALFRCGECGRDRRVPFSCKSRLCPSCAKKRMNAWGEWLPEEVLLDVPHRHWVFTLPAELRGHFVRKRWLLNMLSSTAARVLMRQMTVRYPEAGAAPGVIAVVQTAGDRLNFNPHVHMIATDRCLGPSGRLHRVGYIPYVKLSRVWKTAVLYLLKNTGCLTAAEADLLWKKYPNGFNLNGEVGDKGMDKKTTQRVARYLLRPAMAESRVVRGGPDTVVFAVRGNRDPKTGKRPPAFARLPALEFLARLLAQTPPRHQKLVNYYGLYSNKVRGRWKRVGFGIKRAVSMGPKGWLSWRRLLWRVYEVDPLGCPRCGTEMDLVELSIPP